MIKRGTLCFALPPHARVDKWPLTDEPLTVVHTFEEVARVCDRDGDLYMVPFDLLKLEEITTPNWISVQKNKPPLNKMVLLSWGSLEGSAVGYRYNHDEDEDDFYCIGGDTTDGDDPEYWMPVPKLP